MILSIKAATAGFRLTKQQTAVVCEIERTVEIRARPIATDSGEIQRHRSVPDAVGDNHSHPLHQS